MTMIPFQAGNRSWMVPFTSWIWLLALICRYQHTTIFRTTHTSSRRRCRRSYPIRQRQSCDRCFPINQSTISHARTRTSAEHVQFRSSQQAFHPSTHPRPQQTLLQHWDQLSQNCARGEHVNEPTQTRLD